MLGPVHRHGRKLCLGVSKPVTYVFPAQGLSAFATVDIAHSVVTRRHDSVIGLPLNDVHTTSDDQFRDRPTAEGTSYSHSVKEVRTAVLTMESLPGVATSA